MPVSFVRTNKNDNDVGEGLRRVMFGLGWNDSSKNGDEIDCDASVLLCKNGKLVDFNQDVVYYNNLHHVTGAISHQGDNYSGSDDGQDGEEIYIDLPCLGDDYDRVVFVITMYDSAKRGLDFGLLDGAFILVRDIISDKELCKFDLSKEFAGKSSIIIGELLKDADKKWAFKMIGEGTNDNGILELSKRFQ